MSEEGFQVKERRQPHVLPWATQMACEGEEFAARRGRGRQPHSLVRASSREKTGNGLGRRRDKHRLSKHGGCGVGCGFRRWWNLHFCTHQKHEANHAESVIKFLVPFSSKQSIIRVS